MNMTPINPINADKRDNLANFSPKNIAARNYVQIGFESAKTTASDAFKYLKLPKKNIIPPAPIKPLQINNFNSCGLFGVIDIFYNLQYKLFSMNPIAILPVTI